MEHSLNCFKERLKTFLFVGISENFRDGSTIRK